MMFDREASRNNVTLTMDRLHRYSTPQYNCQSDDQVRKPIQKRFQRKMRSFERLKETYSKGIRNLRRLSRLRSSQATLTENIPPSEIKNVAHESLLVPVASSCALPDDKIERDGNKDQFDSYLTDERIPNEKTASEHSPETTLEWYQRFFNNRPLMRCLDTIEDEDPSESIYERLLEESRRVIGERFTARLDSPTDDADSLYEMLLRETTQEVQQSLQESSRRERNVRTWWDNVRTQLRDEDEPA